MRTFYQFTLVCCIVACSDPPPKATVFYYYLCDEKTSHERSEFILNCVKNSNRDSSMMIEQCTASATQAYCPQVPWARIVWQDVPCSQATDSVRREVCDKIKTQ